MARKRTETATEPSNEIKTRRNSTGAKKRMKTTAKKIHESGKQKSGREEKIPSKLPAESPTSQDQRLIDTKDQAQEVPVFSLHPCKEVQPSGKMKLQLFPLDAHTREGLEKDGFHPYLELTLSSRKKISSVLQHINGKWGSSEIAQGDPTLYPYDKTVLASGHKWIANSNVTIGDIYEAVGATSLFRLRYGWSSGTENETDEHLSSPSTPGIACSQNKEPHKDISNKTESASFTGKQMLSLDNPFTIPSSANQVTGPSTSETILSDEKDKSTENKTNDGPGPTLFSWDDGLTSLSIGGLLSEVSLKGNLRNSNAGNATATLWEDNLTNISIGGLFSEASLKAICGINHEQEPSKSIGGLLSEGSARGEGLGFNESNKIWETRRDISRQSLPLILDSLDAFLAKQTDIPQAPPLETSHSSILDAEDTCHAFSLQKKVHEKVSEEDDEKKQRDESKPAKPLSGSMVSNQDNSLGFSGIKWDVSRGPFDFGLSLSRKFSNEDNSVSFGVVIKELQDKELSKRQ